MPSALSGLYDGKSWIKCSSLANANYAPSYQAMFTGTTISDPIRELTTTAPADHRRKPPEKSLATRFFLACTTTSTALPAEHTLTHRKAENLSHVFPVENYVHNTNKLTDIAKSETICYQFSFFGLQKNRK